MRAVWTIARRELGAYFSSPVAYVFIVIFLLLTGFFTFMVGGFFDRGLADLLPFFFWHPWLYLFLLIALALTFPMVITVAYLGHPDFGRILSGYGGSILTSGAFLAITCMTSALTRNQVISFILSVVICLFLILCSWPPVTNIVVNWAPAWRIDAFAAIGVMTHYEGFQRGVIDSRDLLFFLSVIGFFLFTTSVILRARRA